MVKDFKAEVEEILECINEGKGSWGLFFAKIKFGDYPTKLNLRNMNAENNCMSSGIGLTDEEWEAATNALLRMGFGDINTMEDELKKRKARVSDEGGFFDEP